MFDIVVFLIFYVWQFKYYSLYEIITEFYLQGTKIECQVKYKNFGQTRTTFNTFSSICPVRNSIVSRATLQSVSFSEY